MGYSWRPVVYSRQPIEFMFRNSKKEGFSVFRFFGFSVFQFFSFSVFRFFSFSVFGTIAARTKYTNMSVDRFQRFGTMCDAHQHSVHSNTLVYILNHTSDFVLAFHISCLHLLCPSHRRLLSLFKRFNHTIDSSNASGN
jgi:hypothetical protein